MKEPVVIAFVREESGKGEKDRLIEKLLAILGEGRNNPSLSGENVV